MVHVLTEASQFTNCSSGVFALAFMHALLGRSSATQQSPLPSKWLLCLLLHSGSQGYCTTGCLHPWYPSACCLLRGAKMDETLSSCGSCFWYYWATSAPSSLRAEHCCPTAAVRQPGYLPAKRPLGFASPPHNGFALLASATRMRLLTGTLPILAINAPYSES